MVTSGGYQKKNAITIAESLKNLDEKFGLFSDRDNSAVQNQKGHHSMKPGQYAELI